MDDGTSFPNKVNGPSRHLSLVDHALVHLYGVACLYRWKDVGDYASLVYERGGSVEEVQGCARHLVVYVFPCSSSCSIWASSEMECGFLSADGKADMIIL